VRALASSNDHHTVRVVAQFFASVLESADATASSRFIRSIRLAAFVDLLERSELYPELSKTLKYTLTDSLAQLSTVESPIKYEDEPFDFVYLLNLLVKDSSYQERTNIARALANTLGYEKVSSAEMAAQTGTMLDPEAISTDSAGKQEYLADVLVILKRLGRTESNLPSDLRCQLARIVANLAVVGGSNLKRQICEEKWQDELLTWSLEEASEVRLRIASIAALANLASMWLPEMSEIKRILSSVNTSEQKDPRLIQQTMRLCLAAAEQQPEQTASIGLLQDFVNIASSKSSDVKGSSRALALASLASLVKVPSVSNELLSAGSSLESFWKLLIQSAQHDADSSVRREAVRIIANLCLLDSERVKSKGGIEQVLKECLQSESDAMVVREVIRAQASLASSALKGQARYDEGIFLLHPQPVKNAGTATKVSVPEPAVDIVFIHGVAGHSLWTWRAGPAKPDGSGEICWPRDWIPKDFPNSRIITVSYEVYLSRWEGSAVPLTQQSLTILKKLKLANIGSRPVIFVVHSFGGLVVKDMLRYAAKSKEFKPVRDQTLGIFFFSSPHLGSSLAELTHLIGGYADTLYRSTPAVYDLKPKNQYLRDLNDEFCTYGPSIATFSTGEEESCTLTAQGNKYICYNVVTDESARFSPTGPCQCEHRFLKLPYDHRGVCKPDTNSDLRYQIVVDFIREQLARKDPKLLAAVTQPK
jgi:hypothetical protein